MEIERISFIEISNPGLHMLSKFPMPRLGAVLLATILRDRGYEVKTFVEDIAEPDWHFIENSDLVGISTITATSLKAYAIADRLRARGIVVVMGGVHPSFLPEEALDHADYVVRGEGERALVELISYMEKGSPAISAIESLSYKQKDGKVLHNAQGNFIEDLDSLPAPDFSLVHKWTSSNIYPISTSRGCPFNCKFCSVIHMFGRKYRFRSVESTFKEFKYAASFTKATKFFVDDNFTANKERIRQLLRAAVAEGIKTTWSAQVRTDVANDPELLKLMADTGCHTVFIGFESINPETLKTFNKKQERKDIVNCIRAVKDHGIHIHGMFVLGADTDSLDTIRETAEFINHSDIDTIQCVVLTPLPGTPLFEEMKESGRILHTDWSKYDVQHVVFKPEAMSPECLQLETFKAMGRFYSWDYVLRHLGRLDFHYAAIGVYAKFLVNRVLKEMSSYIDELTASGVIRA